MFREKYFGPIFGVCLSLLYGTTIVNGIWDVWPRIHTGPALLVITTLFLGLYFVGFGIQARRAELKKKIATPGKELRKRRKRFYDWLDSQGRR